MRLKLLVLVYTPADTIIWISKVCKETYLQVPQNSEINHALYITLIFFKENAEVETHTPEFLIIRIQTCVCEDFNLVGWGHFAN
jgi:hypothetical protein